METVVSDDFFKKTSEHCIAIFILEEKVGMAPRIEDDSATLTFIQFRERTFGITCKHVVEIMRKKQSNTGKPHTFFVSVKNHHVVSDRFVYPKGEYGTVDPDIAIREIHPDFPAHVGKVALDVNKARVLPLCEIKLAIAVGFPNRIKEKISEPGGYRIKMPCVHACAENISKEGPSFSLRSELPSTPGIREFSGMSGGPIYWSDAEGYELLGITYEASGADSLSSPATIHLYGCLADNAALENWIKQVP